MLASPLAASLDFPRTMVKWGITPKDWPDLICRRLLKSIHNSILARKPRLQVTISRFIRLRKSRSQRPASHNKVLGRRLVSQHFLPYQVKVGR
jgi:hypothetical protein